MKTDMQLGSFTHAKCQNCGHLGKVQSFDSKPNPNIVFSNIPEGMEISCPVFICPICQSDNTEALFANEVN
jgi:hypothetical protein